MQYSNSDTVVYVGCGERGNEMAEVYVSLSLVISPVLWFLRFFTWAMDCLGAHGFSTIDHDFA